MKKIKGIIDRFEEEFAVVEIEGKTKDYPKGIFLVKYKLGMSFILQETKLRLIDAKQKKLAKEIEDLMNEVWED